MKKAIIITGALLHIFTLLFAMLAGMGMESSGGSVYAVISVLGAIAFVNGWRTLAREKSTAEQQKRGYIAMIIACIPTIPLSLVTGYLPARALAAERGMFDEKVLSQSADESDMNAEEGAGVKNMHTREYFTRKILGPIPFWIGAVVLAVSLLALVAGAGGGTLSVATPAIVLLFIGASNRTPRMTMDASGITVKQNAFSSPIRIAHSKVDGIDEHPKFQLRIRNGKPIVLAKFEFSKETRSAFIRDVQATAGAEPVS
jgi:hypothetical protein